MEAVGNSSFDNGVELGEINLPNTEMSGTGIMSHPHSFIIMSGMQANRHQS